MKFDPKYMPETCASKDLTCEHLTNVHYDKESGRLVATNGHAIVSVPCEPESFDFGGPIQPEALRESRQRKDRKTNKASIRAGKKLLDTGKDGALHRRKQPYVSFPPYKEVFPKFKRGDKGTVSVTINPSLLCEVRRAMGQDARTLLTLTFKADEPLSIIAVSASGAPEVVAAIMPGRY